MDPNEALRLIRLTIAQMRVDESPAVKMAHAEEIVEHFEALDNWLKNDGFLPADWLADEDRCTVQHGDWTGPHVRISSCPAVSHG